MRTGYLTRDGGAFVFQIRVPRALDKDSSLAPIRVRLGNVPPRFARRVADILTGSARMAFQRMQLEMTPDPLPHRVDRLTQNFHATMQLLRGMDAVSGTPLPADLQPVMIEASFDALVEIGRAQDAGTGPFARQSIDFAAPFLAALRSEAVARSMVREPAPLAFEREIPPPEPAAPSPVPESTRELQGLREDVASLAAMMKSLTADGTGNARFKGELFSAAADTYITTLRDAHGDESEEAAYYANRKLIFIALCGDRPVDSYTLDDLQFFVNEIAWLPPNATKTSGLGIADAKVFISTNRELKGQGLAQKTIKNSYLSRVKTILRTGCARAHVSFVAGEGRIIMPKRAAPPKRRPPADRDSVGKIVQAGIAVNQR
ncbi:MAG: hypothetical protein ABSA13_13920 [Beijerinckiaceae bacterium]|jgi:hypothetical protein